MVSSIVDSNLEQGGDWALRNQSRLQKLRSSASEASELYTEPLVSMWAVFGKRGGWFGFEYLFPRHLPFPENARASFQYRHEFGAHRGECSRCEEKIFLSTNYRHDHDRHHEDDCRRGFYYRHEHASSRSGGYRLENGNSPHRYSLPCFENSWSHDNLQLGKNSHREHDHVPSHGRGPTAHDFRPRRHEEGGTSHGPATLIEGDPGNESNCGLDFGHVVKNSADRRIHHSIPRATPVPELRLPLLRRQEHPV